jgi:hypothetical protein
LRAFVEHLGRRFRGLSHEVSRIEHRQAKLSNSTRLTATDSKPLSPIGDEYENQANWNILMSRTVDLEGIQNDGYGYAVTITGPPKESRKLRKRGTKKADRVESPRKTQTSIEELQSISAIEVVMQQTFDVSEVFQERDTQKAGLRRDSSMQHSFRSDQSCIEREVGGMLDWSLLEIPEVANTLPHAESARVSLEEEARRFSASEVFLEPIPGPPPAAITRNTSLRSVSCLKIPLSVVGQEKRCHSR